MTVNGSQLVPYTATALENTTVTVNVSGGLNLGSFTAVTLGGLAGTGAIGLGTTSAPVTLTVGNDNADTEYDGLLMGSGSLVKDGIGKLTVAALNDNPDMGATVNDGFLTVTGTFDVPDPATLTVPVGGSLDGVTPAGATDAIDADIEVSGTFGAGTGSAPGQAGCPEPPHVTGRRDARHFCGPAERDFTWHGRRQWL